jgi:hypothetical protein
MSEA